VRPQARGGKKECQILHHPIQLVNIIDLLAWQKAVALVKEIDQLIEHFPSHEVY